MQFVGEQYRETEQKKAYVDCVVKIPGGGVHGTLFTVHCTRKDVFIQHTKKYNPQYRGVFGLISTQH